MAPSSSFLFLFLLNLVPVLILAESSCPNSFDCQNMSSLGFPLSNAQSDCGLFMLNCTSVPPLIQLKAGGIWYEIIDTISTNNFTIPTNNFTIRDTRLDQFLSNRQCFSFGNLSLPQTPSVSFKISPNLTMFLCIKGTHDEEMKRQQFRSQNCSDYSVYYRDPNNTSAVDETAATAAGCWKLQLPINPNQHNFTDLYQVLTAKFTLEWHISADCMKCHQRGGQCSTSNMNEFLCKTAAGRSRTPMIIASVITGAGVLLLSLTVFFVGTWLRRKRIQKFRHLSKDISSDPSSPKSDIGDGSFYYGTPVFCYNELEEATNNFDPSKELGDGGFGTVYHGILRDGREVAIKRLYEHNYKRVEQFMNEIKILTCLKHQNLVTLYGCTSKSSRYLLLVYEYVQNGTVADHLQKQRAKEAPLTWFMRMNIAIEAASALAYLHKSDIVHRDVKTNNILLDNNFTVKVADFGLSRLFPTEVTHISTAPQGTPGYVDPEYHRCYQLTDKSDVYSFGVVLIELISTKPAVDVTRHRDEINLADLALNRIQRGALDDLIDPSLGYKTDAEIMRMTTSVAELAFQCLQLEKDMRPSMDEVLVLLTEIKNGGSGKLPPSAETHEDEFLKKSLKSSPSAVTDVWTSGSTTTSSIGY